MNAIVRALVALTAVALLSVDDIDQEVEPMDKPTNIDPVQWALYNERASRTLAELSGLPAPEPGVVVVEPREVQWPAPINALLVAVGHGVSDLEGSSELGNKVASNLRQALVKYAKEIGQ
jgi:hypothetical protein